MAPVAARITLDSVVKRARELADFHTRSNPASLLDSQAQSTQKLAVRDSPPWNPGQGASAPTSFNNQAFLALFAILGFAMVATALWFFFWAKNGGFHWREGDWEDYKSTVLRRKGPDGRTLSNATKSTKLGGGSSIAGTQQYKWQKQMAKSVVGRDEKGRKGILAKRGFAGTHSILYSDDYMTESFGTKSVTDEMTEINTFNNSPTGHHTKRYKDRDIQQYKKEKPARVGGINRIADGSHFGTESGDAHTEASDEPLVRKDHRKSAERRAKEEATRMERRWKKEAEAAAAALAREHDQTPPAPPAHRKSATPTATPTGNKSRRGGEIRSVSPKKRDYSFADGPESEVLSTAYTGSDRTASYYDSYRPRHDGYSSDGGRARQSSPRKSKPREGGYRRGVADSDFE